MFLAVPCAAQVSLDRVIINFRAKGAPVTNLTVRNSSNAVLYVRTEPYVVERPGEPEEKLIETDRLLISPKRFSLPANGERVVRLLLRDAPGDIQKVYRASFMPVADEAGLQGLPKQEKGVQLRVLTGMGILVFLEPTEVRVNLESERLNSSIRLHNRGTVNVFFDQGRVCSTDGQHCRDIRPRRLYAGNILEIDALPTEQLSFRRFAQEEYSNIIIPPKGAEETGAPPAADNGAAAAPAAQEQAQPAESAAPAGEAVQSAQ